MVAVCVRSSRLFDGHHGDFCARVIEAPLLCSVICPGSKMTVEEFVRDVIEFVRDHQVWAAPTVFVLAFGESLAFLSLFIPGWAALVGIGALIGASGINFWPVWIAGSLGAALGDWLSYSVGYRFKDNVAKMWPLSRNPDMLERAENFV